MSAGDKRRMRVSCFEKVNGVLNNLKHHACKSADRAAKTYYDYVRRAAYPIVVLHRGNLKHRACEIIDQHPPDSIPKVHPDTVDHNELYANVLQKAGVSGKWLDIVAIGQPPIEVQVDTEAEYCWGIWLCNDYDGWMRGMKDERRAIRIQRETWVESTPFRAE